MRPPPLGVLVPRRKDVFPERTYSFETPPDPIPASDIKETITSEVVVVGGGLAGVSAALSAAEAGAKATLIEKMKTCQARGAQNAFIGSRLQKKLGIEIDKDEVILNLMKYATNKADQRLIRMWAEGSGETADWLLDIFSMRTTLAPASAADSAALSPASPAPTTTTSEVIFSLMALAGIGSGGVSKLYVLSGIMSFRVLRRTPPWDVPTITFKGVVVLPGKSS